MTFFKFKDILILCSLWINEQLVVLKSKNILNVLSSIFVYYMYVCATDSWCFLT